MSRERGESPIKRRSIAPVLENIAVAFDGEELAGLQTGHRFDHHLGVTEDTIRIAGHYSRDHKDDPNALP